MLKYPGSVIRGGVSGRLLLGASASSVDHKLYLPSTSTTVNS